MVDTLIEVARYSRLRRCSRLPGVVDVTSAGGEVVDGVSAEGVVVDTQPTQEGKGRKDSRRKVEDT
jgi:hypothetical protein